MNPTSVRRHSRGLSHLEMILAVGTLAASLGVTVPGLQDLRQRRQLEAATAQLATDIHQTRSLAVARNETLHLRVQTLAAGTCYVIHSGPSQACSCLTDGTAQCTDPSARAWRTVGFEAHQAVRMQANAGNLHFDPHRGTVTPTGTFSLRLSNGQGLDAVVNVMGRVRRCATGQPLPGYPDCRS